MKRTLHLGDITQVSADALIYSTSAQLMLSGGVGACLLKNYGTRFQKNLFKYLDSTGRKLARVGEVLETRTPEMPWRSVLNTIAVDPHYHTDPEVVSSIIHDCFEMCSQDPDIQTLVMSPLGAGYGDLPFATFLDIVTDASTSLSLEIIEIKICCDDFDFYRELYEHAKTLNVEWNQPANNAMEGNRTR